MRGKVLSVIKNPKGVYGFIKTGDGNYYYDTTSLQKGTFLKVGAKVEFDVIPWKGGRTKAVNVKLETIDIEYVVLEEDIREARWQRDGSSIIEFRFSHSSGGFKSQIVSYYSE